MWIWAVGQFMNRHRQTPTNTDREPVPLGVAPWGHAARVDAARKNPIRF
jgi:hypothetical protein